MTKTRIKQISFLLALVMLFGAMSLTIVATEAGDTLYSANWAVSYPYIYTGVNGSASIINSSLFPQELVLKKVSDGWYYATNSDWNADYDGSRYIKESSLTNIAPLQNTTTAQLGSFTVSVDGAIPSDAKLHIQSIAEKDVDPGIWERKDVNMKSFIACFDLKIMQGLSQWQPDGKKVTVTMNAAALGLYTGQEVYIIHMHENADGSKEYETIGPLFVGNGKFSFETGSFSEYAIFQGAGTVVVSGGVFSSTPHTIYAEVGSKISITGQGLLNSDTTADFTVPTYDTTKFNVNTDVNPAVVTVLPGAKIGDSITLSLSWGTLLLTYRASVTIKVGERRQIIETALNSYRLMIAVRKPNPDGSFPSEPSNEQYSANNYHFLTSLYEMNAESGTLPDYASTYLNSAAMAESFGWMYNANGEAIGGVIDALGVYTKALFIKDGTSSIDWNRVAEAIAEYNDDPSKTDDIVIRYNQEVYNGSTNTTTLETRGILLTAATDEENTLEYWAEQKKQVPDGQPIHYSNFNLVPYVVKMMKDEDGQNIFGTTAGDTIWHVDLALTRSDSITLSYELNLGSGLSTSDTVVLPDASVYVEDPLDNDEEITLTVDQGIITSGTSNTTISVTSTTGGSGTLTFQGWSTSTTYTEGVDVLYGPGQTTTIKISKNTKLYAVWKLTEGSLNISTTTLSVGKQVYLSSDAPVGATTPTINGANRGDFAYFDFTIDVPDFNVTAIEGDTIGSRFLDITFEISKLNENGVAQTTSGKLLDYIDKSDAVLSANTDSGKVTTITFKLADGEYLHLLNVPYFDAAANASYNSYTISEAEIPASLQDKYVAYNPTTTLSVNDISQTKHIVYNSYTPPVAGIKISAVNGDDGECYIYRVTGNGVDVKVAVPAGKSVTVTGLLMGTYTVTEEKAWNNLWEAPTIGDVVLSEGGGASVAAEFTYSLISGEKWLYGHNSNLQ